MRASQNARGRIALPSVLIPLVALLALASASPAAEYVWNTGDGNWADASSWSPSGVPQVTGDIASFGASAGDLTVNLNLAAKVGTVQFTQAATKNYFIDGSGSLTFDNGGSGATILFDPNTTGSVAADVVTAEIRGAWALEDDLAVTSNAYRTWIQEYLRLKPSALTSTSGGYTMSFAGSGILWDAGNLDVSGVTGFQISNQLVASQANAFGLAAGPNAPVTVLSGGRLTIQNANGLNAPTTIQSLAMLDFTSASLTGTGTITFEPGSHLRIGTTSLTALDGGQLGPNEITTDVEAVYLTNNVNVSIVDMINDAVPLALEGGLAGASLDATGKHITTKAQGGQTRTVSLPVTIGLAGATFSAASSDRFDYYNRGTTLRFSGNVVQDANGGVLVIGSTGTIDTEGLAGRVDFTGTGNELYNVRLDSGLVYLTAPGVLHHDANVDTQVELTHGGQLLVSTGQAAGEWNIDVSVGEGGGTMRADAGVSGNVQRFGALILNEAGPLLITDNNKQSHLTFEEPVQVNDANGSIIRIIANTAPRVELNGGSTGSGKLIVEGYYGGGVQVNSALGHTGGLVITNNAAGYASNFDANAEDALGPGPVEFYGHGLNALYVRQAQHPSDFTMSSGTLYAYAAGSFTNTNFVYNSGTANVNYEANTFTGATSLTASANLSLTKANNYSGGTTVNNAQLTATWADGSPIGTGTVTLNDGTLQLVNDGEKVWGNDLVVTGDSTLRVDWGGVDHTYSYHQTLGHLTIGAASLTLGTYGFRSVHFADGITLTDGNGSTFIDKNNYYQQDGILADGLVDGPGKLIYDGAGTAGNSRAFWLNHADNTYSGGTQVVEGTFQANATNCLGTGDVHVEAGAMLVAHAPSSAAGVDIYVENGGILQGLWDYDDANASANPLGATTIHLMQGGRLNLYNNLTTTWDLVRDWSTADLVVEGDASVDPGSYWYHESYMGHLTIGGSVLTNIGTTGENIHFTGATLTDPNGSVIAESITYNNGDGVFFEGPIDGAGKLIVNLTHPDNRRAVYLNGVGSYAGGTEVWDGKLYAQAPNSLGTGAVHVSGVGTLRGVWNNTDPNYTSPFGAVQITLAEGALLETYNGNSAYTRDYQADVVAEGNATLNLQGTNYDKSAFGTLTLNGGTFTRSGVTYNSVRFGGLVLNADSTLEDTGSYDYGVAIDGPVSGSGKLTVLGGFQQNRGLYLYGEGTYSGGTDLARGKLYAIGPNSLGTGDVHVSAGTFLYIQNAQHVGDLTNAGTVTISSSIGLVQTGAWSGEAGAYAPAVTVPTGVTLDVASIQAEAITVSGNGRLVLRGASITVSEANSMLSLSGNVEQLDVMANELRVRNVATGGEIAQLDTWVANGVIYSSNPDPLKGLGTAYKTSGADANTYIIKDTWKGDATLDGAVTGADLAALATNWNLQSGAKWTMGDFNGDGQVTGADLAALATNWNKSLAPAGGGAVPEPATLALLGLGAIALIRRKRR